MEWISVKDRLPEAKSLVLGINAEEQRPYVMWFNGVCWTFEEYVIEDGIITHWMPLPDPPKENQE